VQPLQVGSPELRLLSFGRIFGGGPGSLLDYRESWVPRVVAVVVGRRGGCSELRRSPHSWSHQWRLAGSADSGYGFVAVAFWIAGWKSTHFRARNCRISESVLIIIAFSECRVCGHCDFFELRGFSLCALVGSGLHALHFAPQVCGYRTFRFGFARVYLTKCLVRKGTSAELVSGRNSGDRFPIVPSNLAQATLPERPRATLPDQSTCTQRAMPENETQRTHTHTQCFVSPLSDTNCVLI
jgi:hypothetical protein